MSTPPRLAVHLSCTLAGTPSLAAVVVDSVHRAGHRPLPFGLESVDEADLYLGVFVFHGGPSQSDGSLLAEIEYRRALERGIPCLRFVASQQKGFEASEIDSDRVRQKMLRSLKEEVQRAECFTFASAARLRSLVLRALLDKRALDTPGSFAQETRRAVPIPPAFYTVPPYLLQSSRFVGRRRELKMLDDWAASDDRIMVVEAIGGMGKSALTWDWVNRDALAVIPDLVGRVWWSFYERGTSMREFLQHALAYVTRKKPTEFLTSKAHELGDELMRELRRKPYLLVLDGFERVLTAYHRIDKAQVRDETVPVDQRETTNPKDGDILKRLIDCGRSRILVSSRLMPKALEDPLAGTPRRGVRHLHLEGLAPDDAFELMREAGVSGDRDGILRFADEFGRHALLLRIACGMVLDYPKSPGNFDAWRSDKNAGARLRLSDLDLKQRYTHILKYALEGLPKTTLQLLSRIAALSDSSDYDTLAVLNPFVPPRPEVKPPAPFVPQPPPTRQSWRHYFTHQMGTFEEALEIWRNREESQERERAARMAYNERTIHDYLTSEEYVRGIDQFHSALTDLENRGLLQWDRDENTYDLHPVVRAYAFEQLEERERTHTFGVIGDYFNSLPPEKIEDATDLSHVRNNLEIVRAFIGANRYEKAANYYRGDLSSALFFSIGAFHVAIELLTSLLETDTKGKPRHPSSHVRSILLNDLVIALRSVGKYTEAIELTPQKLRIDLEAHKWEGLATGLRNLWQCGILVNRLAWSERVIDLSQTICRRKHENDGCTRGLLDQMYLQTTMGRYDDAMVLYRTFRELPLPYAQIYQPGRAEHYLVRCERLRGELTEGSLKHAEKIAADARNVRDQHPLAAIRSEWELARDNPASAFDAIEGALSIIRRTGEPEAAYLSVRAHALARLKRNEEAISTLREAIAGWDGYLPYLMLHAAETWVLLGDEATARDCLAKAYPAAWADGPPYCHADALERCDRLAGSLGVTPPVLPPFDPSRVEAVPLEAEIRAALNR